MWDVNTGLAQPDNLVVGYAQFGTETGGFNIPGMETTGNEWMGQGHHFSRPKGKSNFSDYAGRVDSEGNEREKLSQNIIDRFQSNRQETDPYVTSEYETIRELPEFGIKDKLKNFINKLSDKRKSKNYAPPMFRNQVGGEFIPQPKKEEIVDLDMETITALIAAGADIEIL